MSVTFNLLVSEFLSLLMTTALLTALFSIFAGAIPSIKYVTYDERFWRRLPSVSCVGCTAALFSKLIRKEIIHGQVVLFWQALDSGGWLYIFIIFACVLLIAYGFTRWLAQLNGYTSDTTYQPSNTRRPFSSLVMESTASTAGNSSNSAHKETTRTTPFNSDINYRQLANKLFATSKSFMYYYGEILQRTGQGIPGSMTYLRNTTEAGTALYVYGMVKIEQQLRKKYRESRYQKERAEMMRAFSTQLMESADSLAKKMSFTSDNMSGYLDMMRELGATRYIDEIDAMIRNGM